MRWMVPAVIPLSHLRKPRLREVKSVAQGKARTYYLPQSLSDSKAQTLTYVAISPKPTAIPVALRPVAWRGIPSGGQSAKADRPCFFISHLPPHWECRVLGEWRGSAHPQSLAAEKLGLMCHPRPGAPATHSGKSHARILIFLSRKLYPNVRAGQLRYLF